MINYFRYFIKALLLYISLLQLTAWGHAQGLTISSKVDGNWTDTSIWSCGCVPGPGDVVVLKHTITLPASLTVSAKYFTYSGGSLIFSKEAFLHLDPSVIRSVQDSSKTIFLENRDNDLLAINAKDGTVKWKIKNLSGYNYIGVMADQQNVYASDFGGIVYAFDIETGAKKWSVPVNGLSSGQSRPELTGDLIYAGSTQKNIYILNRSDGTQKSVISTPRGVQPSLVVANHVVYAGTEDYDNKFYACDATTGQQKWVYPVKKSFFSKPTVTEGIVYMA